MTAQEKYTTSLHLVFSTFLDGLKVSPDLALLTREKFVVFITTLQKKDRDLTKNWSTDELEKFIVAQNVPHKSAFLMKKFVTSYEPSEVDVFLYDFLSSLKSDNKSNSTIKNYKSDILQFAHSLGTKQIKNLFDPENVKHFVQDQINNKLKPSTIKRKLSSISQFALWAETEEIAADASFWISDIENLVSGKSANQIHKTPNQSITTKSKATAKILEDFLISLEVDGHSEATIKNYKSDLGQFFEFSKQTSLEKIISETEIKDFAVSQKELGLKPNSIKRKVTSISQFALWAQKRKLLHGISLWIHQLPTKLFDSKPIQSPVELKLKPVELIHAHDQTHKHVAQKKSKAWSLPVPKFASSESVKAHQSAKEAGKTEENKNVSSTIKSSLKEFAKQVNTKRNQKFLPLLNLAMMILFGIGLVFLGYQQFITQTPSPLAFPTSPVRPNRELSFQGRLTDTAQNPITTATDMAFRLYDTGPGAGGTLLWNSGTCSITPDQDGIFNVGLGDDCGTEITDDVFSENANVWLEVQISTETLTPRQSIKTVPYALNSETVQGYPISATGAATTNTILVMDAGGQVLLGEVSPILKSTTGTFSIEAQTLSLQTSSGSNGDIFLSPDGTGTVIVQSDLDLTGYLHAPGATLSATYAGGTALIARGGPSGTANIQEWQNSAGTPLGVVTAAGNVGINTTTPSYNMEVNGTFQADSVHLDSDTYMQAGSPGYRFYDAGVENLRLAGSVLTYISGGSAVGTMSGGKWNQLTGTANASSRNMILSVTGTGLTASNSWSFGAYFGGDAYTNRIFGVRNDGRTLIGNNGGLAFPVGMLEIYPANTTDVLFVLSGRASQTGDYINVTSDGGSAGDLLTVDASGNVGIGSTTPGYDLDLVGEFNLTDAIRVAGDAGTSGYVLTSSAGGANTWTDPTALAGSSLWTNTLNVYHPKNEFASVVDLVIGGTSTASADIQLFANGGAVFNEQSNNVNFRVESDTNTHGFFLQGSDGNVGISSATPAYKLDVTGTGRFSSTLNANGGINTSTGNLSIDSAGGTTTIADRTIITGDQLQLSTTGNAYVNATGASATLNLYSSSGAVVISSVATARAMFTSTEIRLINTGTSMGSSHGVQANSDATTRIPLGVKGFSGQTANLFEANNSSNVNLVAISASGNLGIGSVTPGYQLDLVGEFNLTDAIRVAGDAGTSGYLLTSSAGGAMTWTDPSTLSASDLWTNTANVYHPSNEFASIVDLVVGGTSTASADIQLFANGGAVFNEQSNNVNFRVESDTNTHGFFLQGSDGNIGIGTSTVGGKLQINGGGTGVKTLLVRGNSSNDANIQEWQNGSGTAQSVVNQTGWIGIGSTSPSAPLVLATSAGNSATGAILSSFVSSYTGGSTQIANNFSVQIPDSATSAYTALRGNAQTGSGNPYSAAGLTGFSGSIFYQASSGTITTATGGGMSIATTGGGSITNAYAMNISSFSNASTGTIANARGINIAAFSNSGGGSITTAYGMYIGSQTAATNNYGIWADAGDWILDEDGDGSAGGNSGGGDIFLGEGQDLELYHDGTNSYIMNNTGNLFIGDAGTDHVILSANGGNVGIGTATPGFTLDLVGEFNLTDAIRVAGDAGTSGYLLTSSAGGANTWTDPSTLGGGTNWWDNTLNVLHARNEYASIVDLVVGGTSTASANIQLFANGGAVFNEQGNNVNFRIESDINTHGFFLQGSNGNIGIGTSTTLSALQVHRASTASQLYITTDTNIGSANDAAIFFQSDNDGTPNPAGLGQYNDGSLRFTGAGSLVTPDMVIADDGNVGIGSTAPVANLNIFQTSPTANQILFQIGTDTSATRFTVDEDGDGHFGGDLDARVFLAGNGTVTGPSLSFVNDTNTGLYRPGVDTLGFVTNSTQRLTIDANGNVGIGSTSPGYALDLVGEFNLTDAIRVAGNAGTSGYLLTSSAGGANTWTDPSTVGTNWWDNTLNVLHARNEYAGVVDLIIGGTSTASANIHLLSDGSAVFNQQGNAVNFRVESDTDINAIFVNGTTNNVGIGTNTPGAKLQVAGNIFPSVDDTHSLGSDALRWADLYLGPASLHIGTSGNEGIIGYNTTSNYLGFDPDGDTTSEVVILDNGNVGIGSLTPAVELDIVGSIRSSALTAGGLVSAVVGTGQLQIATAGSDYEVPLTFENGLTRSTNTIRLGGALTQNTEIPLAGFDLSFTGDGGVGIGTTDPIHKFEVNSAQTGKALILLKELGDQDILTASNSAGTTRFRMANTGFMYAERFSDVSNSQYFLDPAGGTTSMAVLSNVGIGTTTPGARLDVRNTATEDILNLFDDTTEVLTVIDGGNVGIGTTTPIQVFHVAASNGSSVLFGDGDGTDSNIRLLPDNTDGYNYIQAGISSSDTDARLRISRYLTGTNTLSEFEVYAIRSYFSGNVGVGTTAPAFKLEVLDTEAAKGTLQLTNTTAGTSARAGIDIIGDGGAGYIYYRSASSTFIPDALQIASSGGPIVLNPGNGTTGLMYLTEAGNVGIGTTAPISLLHVGTDNTAISNFITIGRQGTVSGGIQWSRAGGTIDAQVYMDNLEDLRISNDFGGDIILEGGNVGIGTVTPGAALNVNGVIMAGNASNITAPVALAAGDIIAGDTSGGFQFDASANDLYAQQSSANNTGVHFNIRKSRGTAASPDTTVTGDDIFLLRAYGNAASSWFESSRITFDTEGTIGMAAIPGLMRFYTANSAGTLTQRMTINSSGTVAVTGSIDASVQFLGQSSDSATAPSFSWTGDTNVGIYRPTTDVIGFTTAGVERMRVDSGGVEMRGDSTNATFTSPGPLAIKNSGSTPFISFHATGGARQGYIQGASTSYNIFATLNVPMTFGTNSIERMRIAGDGDISIGTTTAGGHKLAVTSGSDNTTTVMRIERNEETATNEYFLAMWRGPTVTQDNEFLLRSDGVGFADGSWNGGGADVAEMYAFDHSVEPGDLVSIPIANVSSPGKTLAKSNGKQYDSLVVGVVSTDPGLVAGFGDINIDYDYHADTRMPVALVGRVPVKVSLENGPIAKGDFLTSSSIPGVAMKATKGGRTIGQALETYNGTSAKSAGVIQVETDYEQKKATDARSVPPLKPGEAKIMVYVATSWYEPQINLAESSELHIVGDALSGYSTKNGESTETKVGSFAKAVIANITAGLINTQDLIVQKTATIKDLSVETLTINGQTLADYIASVVGGQVTSDGTALISPLANDTIITIASQSGKIAFTNGKDEQIAQLDQDGNLSLLGKLNSEQVITTDIVATGSSTLGSLLIENDATVAGTLTANHIDATSTRISQLEAGMAQLQHVKAVTADIMTATVSGTLYANNIYDFENKVATTLQQPGILDTLLGNYQNSVTQDMIEDLYSTVNKTEFNASAPHDLDLSLSELSATSDDVVLTGTALFVEKYFKVNGAGYISDSLAVGNTLFVGESMMIADGSIQYTTSDPDNQILQIQPSGQGSIELLAGIVTIDDSGKVIVNGDFEVTGNAKVAGTLLTDSLKPADFGNPFQVQVAGVNSGSDEVKKSRFEIINEIGTPVATFSAQGDAQFAGKVDIAGGIGIESQDLGSNDSNEFDTNKTSGKATIKSGANEVTIKTGNIKGDTLIYVTAVGSTGNQVLYVKSQTADNTQTPEQEGRFVVGFDNATQADVSFNWWIVN